MTSAPPLSPPVVEMKLTVNSLNDSLINLSLSLSDRLSLAYKFFKRTTTPAALRVIVIFFQPRTVVDSSGLLFFHFSLINNSRRGKSGKFSKSKKNLCTYLLARAEISREYSRDAAVRVRFDFPPVTRARAKIEIQSRERLRDAAAP